MVLFCAESSLLSASALLVETLGPALMCVSILEAGEAEMLQGDCFAFEAVTAPGCLTQVDNSDTCASEWVTQNTVLRGRPIATCR